ncbi:hypothetical protein ACQ4PT_021779 [Festuca glaucescens]
MAMGGANAGGGPGKAATGGSGTAAAGDAGTDAAAGGAGTDATAGGAGTAAAGGTGTDAAAGGAGADAVAGEGVPVECNLGEAKAKMGHGTTTGVAPGMDPNSTYSLKIRLLGNPKKARKEIKYFCFEKVIDCDLTNYKDLVEAIVEEYPPRYLEVAHVQYYDDVLKIFPEVNSDQELMSMFEKHSQKKVVEMFIAYCDPAEAYKPITEYYSDVHIQPENNVDQDEDSYLRNPIPENEHVGIDEENTYLEKDHMPLNVVKKKTLVSMIALVQEGKRRCRMQLSIGYVRRQAIGSPTGLVICTDAGQAVMTGVKEVFPEAEHRECMFHLVSNFKKKFHGKVFDDHLWAAAYSWNPYVFDKHWVAMEAAKQAATAYIRKWHNRLWSRSQFSTICKVDYVTNNLAECFNNWIKHHKSLNLDDFMDKARQLLMIMSNRRRNVAKKLDGLILPHIIKKLNAMTRELNLEVVQSSEEVAEVTALGGSGFRAAYAQLIPAMPDKNQWPESDHGFFMHPPLLKATAGRPKTERYKGCSEKKRKSGKHLCPICKDYGHHWHNCKKGNPEDIAAMLAVREPPKKKIKTMEGNESAIVPCMDEAPTRMSFPPSLENSSYKKGKGSNSGSGGSKRSRTGTSQREPISIELPIPSEKTNVHVKVKSKKKTKDVVPIVPLDSPAMSTRSKKFNPPSPAMSTRSKRRLSL